MTLYLQPAHRLSAEQPGPGRDQVRHTASAGVEAGFWWGELLTDQRPVDAFSLTYDSQVLTEDTAILGLPRVSLRVAAGARLADWFVRLSDGAQRDSMAKPEDLVPGKIYPLSLDLHLASWVFPKGHRIRVAVSNALWRMNWPTPYLMTTSVMLGRESASRIVLPRVPVHGPAAPAFAAPEPIEAPPGIKGIGIGGGIGGGGGAAWPGEWTVLRDEA